MAKYNVLFVLGGPGAGKGTQCEKIVEVRCSFLVTSFGFIKESLLSGMTNRSNQVDFAKSTFYFEISL